jgi:hypothetical protein
VVPSVAGARSATVVSAAVRQVPPSPWAVQLELPVLSRTPVTSPDAAPDVVEDAEPVQDALVHSTPAPAVLTADSSRPPVAATSDDDRGAPDTARSVTSDAAPVSHPPAVAVQVESAFVSRTGGAPPAAALPVTFPVVALDAFPEHPAASPQSTLADAALDARASPSVSAAVRAGASPAELSASRNRLAHSPTGLSVSVELFARHAPEATSQPAAPVLVRAAPARTPVAVPPVLAAPVPLHPATPAQSTSTSAAAAPRPPVSPSARDSLCVRQPPPPTAQFAAAFVAVSGVAAVAPVPVARAALFPVSLLLVARPVQAASHATAASAPTAPRPPRPSRSARSTELEVPQPPADSQRADPLPCPRDSPPAAASPPARVVLITRLSPRSAREPVLPLSHVPPPVRQPDCAPAASAEPLTSHRPVHDAAADAFRSPPAT